MLFAPSPRTLRPRLAIIAPLVVAIGLGASGCVSFHDYPLNASENAADFQNRTLTDPSLKTFVEKNLHHASDAWPPTSWTLDTLTLAAFYFHPDLDVARAQLAGARAAGVTADAIPNPTISLVPSYDSTAPPPWILGLSLDIPIETAGKRGYRADQAAHLTDAALSNLATTAWQVRSRVRKALLAQYAAGQSQTLLKNQEGLQARSVELLEGQLRLGNISPFEVTQARISLNETRFALRDADKKIATARAQLAAAVGVPLAALDVAVLDFDQFKHFSADIPDAAARQQALVNRADIRRGLAEYAAAQSALQLEVAKQFPDIHLGPGYVHDQTDDKWTVGLTFEVPLLNQHRGPIAEAEARRAEAAAKFNTLQTSVLTEIDQSVAEYRISLQKVEAAQSLIGDLEAQFRIANGMFEAGEISRVELAQRQLELTTASLAQLDALVAAQEALGTLEDALQSPAQLSAVTEQSPRAAVPDDAPALPRLVQTVPLPLVKGGFDLMAIDLAGQRLFLDAEDNDTTEVIDLAAGRVGPPISGVQQPKWVVYRPELGRLYVAGGDGPVRVFDARTLQPLRSIPLKEKANNLRFDPKTGELFVGVGKTFGAIAIIDTRDDTVTAEISLAASPNQFELDDKFIYVNVPEANHVAVIDRLTKAVVATWLVAAGSDNRPMALDRINHRLFIGCQPGKLAVLNSTTGKLVETVEVAGDADGVSFDAERHRIYVSSGQGSIDVVRQLDADHFVFAGRVPTVKGASTSLFVPEVGRLFLAVPQGAEQPAELRAYAVR